MPFYPSALWAQNASAKTKVRRGSAQSSGLQISKSTLLLDAAFLYINTPRFPFKSIFSSPWFPCNVSSLSFWIYFSGSGQPSFLRCEHSCLSWLLLSHCNGSLSVSSLHAVSISLWLPSFFHVLPARILNLKAASQIGSAFALPHAGLRLFTGAH